MRHKWAPWKRSERREQTIRLALRALRRYRLLDSDDNGRNAVWTRRDCRPRVAGGSPLAAFVHPLIPMVHESCTDGSRVLPSRYILFDMARWRT